MVNLFDNAVTQLDEAAELLNLDSSARELLRRPRREFAFTVSLEKDDGSYAVFPGFRIQYNDARGPTCGGVRFGPGETAANTRARAAWTAWKAALVGLPLGGAYGGLTCYADRLSARELESATRGYARAVAPFIGPGRDIIAPGIHAPPGTATWMDDEFSVINGGVSSFPAASAFDKAVAFPDDGAAYAKSGLFCEREAAKYLDIELKGARTVVYGFNAIGAAAVKLSTEHFGSRAIAVADPSGGIYNPDGIDADDVNEFIQRTGSLLDFPGAENVKPEELLELECDILWAADGEAVISAENADRIKARILVEAADGATTPETDEILHSAGVFVVPDVLCTVGAVATSYFARTANWGDNRELEKTNVRLDERTTKAFHDVLEERNARNVHMRNAAYLIIVERVVEAMRRRGWC
ncbi:MAG: Glu/Leu/Phe/Val dehydrogenase [Candidatus Coatesbacteria bacterium]|nr:MAG: Glu/Leu/Phe/Val dehydrogenase [Candidatus Coatesbacteria bacterium]